VIHARTSEWARDRPRVRIPRNVGGTPKNKWSPEDDARVVAAIHEVGLDSWSKVASLVPGRTGKQCRERWLDKLSPEVVKHDWCPEEDATIIAMQGELGNSWAKIRDCLPGRSVGAIKNRWNWLERRDIPNHAEEFQILAAEQSQSKKQEASNSTEEVRFELWEDGELLLEWEDI
jgi:hypothetical protein